MFFEEMKSVAIAVAMLGYNVPNLKSFLIFYNQDYSRKVATIVNISTLCSNKLMLIMSFKFSILPEVFCLSNCSGT